MCSPSESPGVAGIAGGVTNAAFLRSKAMLGSIAGIERARVADLCNPEPDRPLAPHWRVSRYNERVSQ